MICDLARQIVDAPLEVKLAWPIIGEISDRIATPWGGGQKVVTPLTAIRCASIVEENASVFVFDDHSVRWVDQLKQSMRTFDDVAALVKVPCPRMFLEYQAGTYDRRGIYIESHDGDRLRFVLFHGEARMVFPLPRMEVKGSLKGIAEGDRTVRGALKIQEMLPSERMMEACGRGGYTCPPLDDPEKMALRSLLDVWGFMLLLNCEGAAVINRRATKEGRLNSRQLSRRNGSAVLSYISVQLRKRRLPFSNGGHAGGPGVRRHQVIGHLHTYIVGGERVLRWIDAYWKGDASLGVVIKRREVKRPPPEHRHVIH